MRRRIYWNMCLMALLAIVLSAVMTTIVYYDNLEEQMHQEVVSEAHYLEAGIEVAGVAYLNNLAGNARGADKNRITLIDRDGTVLYDNYAAADIMGNHLDRPEVQEAFRTGSGSEIRMSDTLSETTFYYALLLDDGTVVRVANTSRSVLGGIVSTLPLLVATTVMIMAFSMLVAKQQTARIVEPINQMNLNHPSESKVYDELAPLACRVEHQQRTIRYQMDTLKARQREFTAITENMSEGFIVIGRWGEVVSYNTSAIRILGVETSLQAGFGQNADGSADVFMSGVWEWDCRAEMSGEEDNQFREKVNVLSFNRSHIFREVVDQVLGGEHCEQLMEINGRVYQLIANPVQEDSRVTGAIIVILDVTEKEQRENLRREFSANVSHELKTPLTSISGYAEIMKSGLVKPEDMTRFSEKIYKEAQRMITLVGDIIRLSQLDESKGEVDRTRVDLYELSRTIVERLRMNACRQQVEITLEGVSQVVLGSGQILDEMIHNLCDNAIKYNKPGGYVKVTVTEEQGHPVVCVEDNGIGIPDADQERVFERFYRVDKSHSRQIGGTGLGLSIVKHGAIYHGARVELESKLGVGTKIRVVFSAGGEYGAE